jgi:hypothetical protein
MLGVKYAVLQALISIPYFREECDKKAVYKRVTGAK